MRLSLLFVLSLLLASCCGNRGGGVTYGPGPSPEIQFVTKAVAEIPVLVSDGSIYAATGSETVFVTVTGNVTYTMSSASFSSPTNVHSDVLDFGSLEVTDLRDNQLRVCGTGGNEKCTNAYLLVYTTGTAGSGLYNDTDGYGLPLYSSLSGVDNLVGLGQGNAAIMQSITIPSNKNVVKLSDFSVTPIYDIFADSSNAGVGSYSTTIIIEFALSL